MGLETTRPDNSRDEMGRLTDKDTAQFAAEAVDQLQINAQKQAEEHIADERKEYNEADAAGGTVLKEEHFENFLAEDTERVQGLQTSEGKIDALDKAVTDDLMSGASDIKESGRESARVEEVRTRGLIANIRAKLFGEKPFDK